MNELAPKCKAVSLLALCFLPSITGFVVPTTKLVQRQQSWTTPTTPTRRTQPLEMGIVEDLFEKADKSSRNMDNDRYLQNTLQPRVERINALELDIENLEDDELEAKTAEFRERLAKSEDIQGKIVEEAFAVVREASWYVFTVVYTRLFTRTTCYKTGVFWNCDTTMYN